jgi:acetyltransferase-like isoleucine patch superfamily enzyme
MRQIISPNIRVRLPEHFEVGSHSIVDDFCYFSTRVIVGIHSHIASGCSVAGGRDHTFRMGDFSSLSSGVKIWCASNDYVNDLVMIQPVGLDLVGLHPMEGNVVLGHYTGVGANAVIMPDNDIPEGTVIGALSLVMPRSQLEPWAVYAGVPARFVRRRNRDNVERQVRQVREHLARLENQ